MRRISNYLSTVWSRKEHPYKIPAFSIGFLGLVLYLICFVDDIVYSIVYAGYFDLSMVIDLIFYGLVFYYLLYYNYIDNTRAISGILCYVLYVVLNAIINAFFGGTLSIISVFLSGSVWLIVLEAISLAILVMIAVSGFHLYKRSRSYVYGVFHNWKNLRNWALAFTILNVLYQSTSLVFLITLGSGYIGWDWALAAFSILTPICITLCCFFTLLRMKGF